MPEASMLAYQDSVTKKPQMREKTFYKQLFLKKKKKKGGKEAFVQSKNKK